MKTKLRRALSFLALSPLVIAASCSSDPKTRGQIMIAISSDLSVPANMDEVVVEIVSDDGQKQQLTYLIKPNEPGKPLPGTVAIVPPNSGGQRLRVRVIGQLNKGQREARVLREALVVVPRDRVGLLQMPIRWLCDGEITEDEIGNVESTCDDDTLTCKAGACVSADLTAVELPEYRPAAVYGGGDENGQGGVCFDAPACFLKGVTVPLGTDCTVPLPGGGEGVSVGVVPTDRRRGICREGDGAGDCYIPIDRDDEDGWREVNGRIQLPPSLCNGPKAGQVRSVVVTTACNTKDIGTPICGPWTNVKTAAPVGVQTPPIGGGGDGDGGVDVAPDGGAGGTSPILPEAGTCVGEGLLLEPMAAGAMFILLDGSSQMMQTGASVPNVVLEWMSGVGERMPELGIGLGVGMNGCDVPLSPLLSVVPASSHVGISLVEIGMGEFPLDKGLQEGRSELLRWSGAEGEKQALVVVSAQGPLDCSTDAVTEMVSGFAQEGLMTHVLSPGPGSTLLDEVASAGMTGGAVTFSGTAGLRTALDTIAMGLAGGCTFRAPPGAPGAAIVSLQNADLGRVVLEYRGDAGCTDAPGYTPDPGGDPGYIHLCPSTCALLQAAPGTQIIAELGCSPPPLGTGGGSSGVGGAGGVGGGGTIPEPGSGGASGMGGSDDGSGGAPGSGGSAGDREDAGGIGPGGSGQGGGPGTEDAGGIGPGGSGQGGGPVIVDASAPPTFCEPSFCPTPPEGVACCIASDGPCGADLGTGCGCPTLPPASFDPCAHEGQLCSFESGASCFCSVGEG